MTPVSYELDRAWFERRSSYIWATLFLGGSGAAIPVLFGYFYVRDFNRLLEQGQYLALIFLFHAVLIAALFAMAWKAKALPVDTIKPSVNPELRKKAIEACARFRTWWLYLLGSWLVFYATLALQFLSKSPTLSNEGPLLQFAHLIGRYVGPPWLVDGSNAVQGLFLFLLYRELAYVTVGSKEDRAALSSWGLRSAMITVAAVVAVTVFLPGDETRHWVSLANGLFVGSTMALMAGRFESPYIHLRWPIVAALFIYAVLQMTYPMLHLDPQQASFDDKALLAMVILAVMLLKMLLFLVVDWFYTGGKLLFYMCHERKLIERSPGDGKSQVERDWSEFYADPQQRPEESA